MRDHTVSMEHPDVTSPLSAFQTNISSPPHCPFKTEKTKTNTFSGVLPRRRKLPKITQSFTFCIPYP